MKYLSYSLLFSAVFLFVQCNGKPDRPETILNETQKAYDGADLSTTNAPATPPPAMKEPAQNSAGVWHYICPDGHAGGAGAAGPCATCSKMMIHNSAYHQTGQNAPNISTSTGGAPVQPGSTISFDPNNPGGSTNQITLDPSNSTQITSPGQAKTPEPAQNAAGVWHYTCSNGCAGGGGSATPCGTCGTNLVHNQAYHM